MLPHFHILMNGRHSYFTSHFLSKLMDWMQKGANSLADNFFSHTFLALQIIGLFRKHPPAAVILDTLQHIKIMGMFTILKVKSIFTTIDE